MDTLSKLLSSDGFIICNKYIAKTLGLEEAVILGLLCSAYEYWKSKNQLQIIEGEKYFYLTREKIEEEVGFKESRQRAAMDNLVQAGILKIKKFGLPAKNYYLINFENLFELLKDKSSSNQVTSDVKIKPLEALKSSLNNNKIIKKENNNISSIEDNILKRNETAIEIIIDYLNHLAGTRYKVTTEANIKNIKARLTEGYTISDLKLVIEYKCKEWKGTDMQKYLRPETLFRPSKFEGYLNAALSNAPIKTTKHPDSAINHETPTAFRDLPKAVQKEKLSGVQF